MSSVKVGDTKTVDTGSVTKSFRANFTYDVYETATSVTLKIWSLRFETRSSSANADWIAYARGRYTGDIQTVSWTNKKELFFSAGYQAGDVKEVYGTDWSYTKQKTTSAQTITVNGLLQWQGMYNTGTQSTATLEVNVPALALYTITSNPNGGSGGGSSSVYYGQYYTFPSAPSRSGYTFKNWDGYSPGSSYGPVTASKTFNAVWSPNPYTISYNANGGSGAPGNQTKYHDQALTLSSTKPTRTGYTFKGWATSSSGSVVYQPSGVYTANSAATLYAVWQANSYTISYNSNGGLGTIAPTTRVYDASPAQLLSDGIGFYKRELASDIVIEYELINWNTLSDGSGTTYSLSSSAPNITQNLTLYAIWEIKYIYPSISNFVCYRTTSSSLSDKEISLTGSYIYLAFSYTGYSENGGETYGTPSCRITIDSTVYTPALSYSYIPLANPSGNPSNNKYYVYYNNEYILTTDTQVVSGTVYYIKGFEFKPTESYSPDVAHSVLVELYDPSYTSSYVSDDFKIATAVLPFDFYGYNTNVYMGIMHPHVTGQPVTIDDTYIDGGLYISIDDSAASGIDYDLYSAITTHGWNSSVIE